MTTSSTAGSATGAELAAIPLVWMYHSIAPYDEDPYEVTMTPQRFEQQLRWLRRRGLRVAGSGLSAGGGSVVAGLQRARGGDPVAPQVGPAPRDGRAGWSA